jgi:hypothetical protein
MKKDADDVKFPSMPDCTISTSTMRPFSQAGIVWSAWGLSGVGHIVPTPAATRLGKNSRGTRLRVN